MEYSTPTPIKVLVMPSGTKIYSSRKNLSNEGSCPFLRYVKFRRVTNDPHSIVRTNRQFLLLKTAFFLSVITNQSSPPSDDRVRTSTFWTVITRGWRMGKTTWINWWVRRGRGWFSLQWSIRMSWTRMTKAPRITLTMEQKNNFSGESYEHTC